MVSARHRERHVESPGDGPRCARRMPATRGLPSHASRMVRANLIFTFLAQFRPARQGEKHMFDWKFRIGTKLAMASGLGVLLMAGIVVNQQWSGGSTQDAIQAALRQSQIQADGL